MKSILIIYHGGQFDDFVHNVEKTLINNSLKVTMLERECLNSKCYKNIDLIIVIGGDGTFLRASHYNTNVPMFGINPMPHKKEGFYMQGNVNNFKRKIQKLLSGKYNLIKLFRLNVYINSEKLNELVLNDVFIGDAKPYNMFNYELNIAGKKEFQRSSGVIIGTPSGSHAWLKSAGGKVLKINEQKYQYISRELYERKLTKNYTLNKGLIDKTQNFELVCKSPGILVIDSISEEYKINREDKIIINGSNDYLDYIVF